jgi:uncharacterized membrane protein (Fun14 family)
LVDGGYPTGYPMKIRSTVIAVSMGMIILSVFMLVKQPAYGMANIGRLGLFMRDAAPVLMAGACFAILFSAVKLRILSILGIGLIVGSLAGSAICMIRCRKTP